MNNLSLSLSPRDKRRRSIGGWAGAIISLTYVGFLGFAVSVVIRQQYFFWTDTLMIALAGFSALLSLIGAILTNGKFYKYGANLIFIANILPPLAAAITLQDISVVTSTYLLTTSVFLIGFVLPKASHYKAYIALAVALLVSTVFDIANPPFQAPTEGIEKFAPFITIAIVIAFTLLALQRAWTRKISTKILTGFALISIVGGAFAFVGSQFAFGGIKNNALPSLAALGRISQTVRGTQADVLGFVAIGDTGNVNRFHEKVDTLENELKEIEALSVALEQPDVFIELDDAVAEMTFVGDRILQSHQKTLELLAAMADHQERANLALRNAEIALNAEADTDIAESRLDKLSDEVIPAKDALARFGSLVNDLGRESQAFVASGSEKSAANYANATIRLAEARSKLVSTLTLIGGQEDLIAELQQIELETLTISQEIITAHSVTTAALEQFKETDRKLQSSLAGIENLVDEGVQTGVNFVNTFTIVTSLISLGASLLIGLFITNTITTPLSRLVDATRKLEAGDITVRATLRAGDELGSLANAFNSMAERLGATLTSLEEQVAQRTQALEQRSQYLESAAEVNNAVSLMVNPDEIISQVVSLIQEKFSFYYVGFFTLDENEEWAVLKAGTGAPGQAMLARGHRIKIGEGMIGWCIQNGKARIALDVGDDAVRFENPYLPKTHSEVALPLRSRGKVLGALTVQSAEVAAFDQDIMATLQTMTDQIATSLANAELFAQNEAALEAERRAYGEFSYQAWVALAQGQTAAPRYISDAPGKVYAAQENPPEEIAATLKSGVAVIDNGMTALLPVKSRGAVLGGIKLRKQSDSGRWTKSQIAMAESIAEQLSVTLESARLFEESQRRAMRERLIGEASTHMRETLNIESVLETAAQELHKILGKVETEVWLDAEAPAETE